MENMIVMNQQSKPDFLKMKSDDKVEYIVNTTDKQVQKKLHNQAVVVLELLRDEKFQDIYESHLELSEMKHDENKI